ncbi:hypothetical protein EV198_0067 [Roseivirga ehrenbergii]|uniref:Uncharacterized protein n=3 Tax=Roseivirga TaxID=290180 RepID=A0A0L8AIY0_9BACT|nr:MULTISPECIES: hypothetical protein [Roseivirga]KOF02192.1 hypothetical protein OB69_13215 [Roseivirga seohaensis subsp. aquiponti]KYG72023.1 hypothetical protein MB14_08175 [Roseivirga ehrenbergii]KYG80882.1 hypothetical protein AWW67_08660 [Roseivirga seohaensis]TCL13245.1 hypothetical protein EV198_0067 [Roseivirga ehrenbergii]
MSSPSPKPRVIKDFDKLDVEIQEQIKLEYPEGFEDNLIYFTNKDGKRVSALPFETEEKYYLVRMTVEEAQQIIEDDDDYDADGNLKDEIKEEYEERHAEDVDDEDEGTGFDIADDEDEDDDED